ncbi:NAD-dependent epimerase/dehydratase family protein [Silvanigrella paludirubra]|uniref:NAD-dependent epimerase/dehydratase family protein n=1 Tax=Silvanigrella paludirubra TaxID=2499159 RepID=A0A6N6VPF5_9BACT|nr:NAD-dependent epimerase/dehydratase family protein [Silvanigrella paludirubra]KAB8036826.1 NAD-dependent epimerase/dehydratase family protein [Silvanigrella paludirubra]
MKKSIVTGGAGFIGSHLVTKLLQLGHSVLVLDNFSNGRRENLASVISNPNLLVKNVDLSEFNAIESFDGYDNVFHLAALADIVPSIQRPLEYHKSNVDATVNVLIKSVEAKIKKFVYAASSSCYGISSSVPTNELSMTDPQYPYALTKYIGEQCVLHWEKIYKLPTVSLRLFNVFGPRSRTNGTYGAVFGVFLAQKLAQKPYTVVGDGNQKRDFIYVSDVVEAFIKASQSNLSGEVINIGSGKPKSINNLVELLQGDVEYIPKRPGEPDITHADILKSNQLLNWTPQVSFEDGVKSMIEHIDYWKTATVWDSEQIKTATKDWFFYLH